jgi:hypothetical protein
MQGKTRWNHSKMVAANNREAMYLAIGKKPPPNPIRFIEPEPVRPSTPVTNEKPVSQFLKECAEHFGDFKFTATGENRFFTGKCISGHLEVKEIKR